MTTEERQIVEEMVENNILKAISSLLLDLAHGVPTNLLDPTPNKELNKKIRKVVAIYRKQIIQNYLKSKLI